MTRARHLAALVLATSAGGCTAPALDAQVDDLDARERVQLGDVSVLLPLARTRDELAEYLTASSAARGGELLPRAVYEAAFGPPGQLQAGGTPAAPRHADLRLVAFRFDPCFAHLGPVDAESECDNQLRLVFQTFSSPGGADDSAVHAFYALERDELAAAIEEMIAIRGAVRLGPLGPHPLVTAEGLAGPTADALAAVVTRYAGAASLTRITAFTTSGLGSAWNFSGFDVLAGGPKRLELVDVPAGTEVLAFFRGFSAGKLGGEPPFSPPSSAPAEDNMQLLGNETWAARASATEREVAFDAAVRIENPTLHTPETTDCASCHAAAPARAMVGEALFGLADDGLDFVADGRLVADGRFVPTEDLAELPQDATVSMHMFSYKGATPSIHRRTIHESAAVVAFLETWVRSRGEP
jgi:hypothetical protein